MVEMGHIMDDSVLNASEDLYYCIGRQGSQQGNPEKRYIEVAK